MFLLEKFFEPYEFCRCLEVTSTVTLQFIILFTRQFKPSIFVSIPRLGQVTSAREQKFTAARRVIIALLCGWCLVKSISHSHMLEYGSVVWSPFTARNITKLERVQHRATKFILKTDDDYDVRISKLNLLSLEHRRFLFDVLFFL